MKKLVWFCFLCTLFIFPKLVLAEAPEESYPQEILDRLPEGYFEDSGNSVRLEDGNMVVEREVGEKILDYNNPSDMYAPYQNLKKWKVTTNPNKVDEALKVFNKKGSPPYDEKYWLINKDDGSQVLIEYSTMDPYSAIQFSPDEDYAYYKYNNDMGGAVIYGVNLNTNTRFQIGNSNEFHVIDCPQKSSYISLIDDTGREQTINVYNLDGTRVNVLHPQQPMDFYDIENSICY